MKLNSPIIYFFTFLISLLVGFPHLVGILKNDPYISTVIVNVASYTFDENHYATRIQKVFSTGKPVGDGYVYEHKDDSFILPQLSTLILGYLSKLLGSVQNMFVVTDFIFPPIIFLVLYFLFKEFISNKLISLIGAFYLLFENQIYGYFPTIIKSILSLSPQPVIEMWNRNFIPPFYSRVETPGFTGIFLFLSLYSLLKIFKSTNWTKYHAIYVFSMITLVYSYPFFPSFLIPVSVGLFFYKVVSSKSFESSMFLALFLTALGSSLYVVEGLNFLNLPQAADYSMRLGKETGLPYIPISSLITFVVLLIIYKYKSNFKTSLLMYFIFMAIVSMFVFPVQRDHHVSRILVPILRLSQFYLLFLLTNYLIAKYKIANLINIALKVFLILIVIGVGINQYFYSKNTVSDFTLAKNKYEAYQWVATNLPSDSVVLSYSIETNFQLPSFAGVYMFLPYSMFTFAPSDEIEDRLLRSFKTVAATETKLRSILSISPSWNTVWRPSADELETKGGFIYYGNNKIKKTGHGLDEKEMNEFLNKYQNTRSEGFLEIKKNYKLDYLFWGEYEKKNFTLPDNNLQKVYENPSVTIYKIRTS